MLEMKKKPVPYIPTRATWTLLIIWLALISIFLGIVLQQQFFWK